MKSRKIIISIVTVLMLTSVITSPGCAWLGGEKPSLELMKTMPRETTSFVYWDIEALRDNSDLTILYDDWMSQEGEPLERFGVRYPSVDYFASGGEEGTTKVFAGNFDRKYITEALVELNYDRQSYPGEVAEKWIGPTEEDKAVGLVEDVVIIGSESSVEDFIDVFRNEKSSLEDDQYAKGVIDRLPSRILVVITTVKESPKYHRLLTSGVSYEKEEEGILRMKAVYRFDGKGFAEDSLMDIRDDWEIERDYYKVEAKHHDEFVELTALTATKNFSYF